MILSAWKLLILSFSLGADAFLVGGPSEAGYKNVGKKDILASSVDAAIPPAATPPAASSACPYHAATEFVSRLTDNFADNFEKLKTFDGPSLFDVPSFVTDVRENGIPGALGTLAERHGKAFSLGPLVVVSGNPRNVDAVYRNTNLPSTVLPGLPRDSGFCSDSPRVLAECRRAFIRDGATKEGSHRVLSSIAFDIAEAVKDAASSGDDNLRDFRFTDAIATPSTRAANSELVFASSMSEDPTRARKASRKLQLLASDVSKMLGAQGITRTLFRPWEALSATKRLVNALDSTIFDAPTKQSQCPLARLGSSVSAGKVEKTDAISTAAAMLYFGADTTRILSDTVMRLLAHPDHAALQAECRREVDAVLSGRNKVVSTGDHVEEMHLLKATFAETLRCHEIGFAGVSTPPFIATRDFELEGRTVTKGSYMMMTSMDHAVTSVETGNEKWVKDPSTFDPRAWLDDRGRFDEKLFRKFAFFGSGAHKCPARQVGLDTSVAIVASTLSNFDDVSLLDCSDDGPMGSWVYEKKMSAIAR